MQIRMSAALVRSRTYITVPLLLIQRQAPLKLQV